MNLQYLAKKVSLFRDKYSPLRDQYKKFSELKEYYSAMLGVNQIELLFSAPKNGEAELLAVCEVWFVKEKDIARIAKKLPPLVYTKGDICFVANFTHSNTIKPIYVLNYFKEILKRKYPYCQQCFWYNHRRGRISRIFKVQRYGVRHPSNHNSG